MLYSGEQFDPNLQMQYLRARYYDQNNGTFNRVDPFAGNAGDPQSLHKYAYCHGDAVNGIDPSGLKTLANLMSAISIVAWLNVTLVSAINIGNFVSAASDYDWKNGRLFDAFYITFAAEWGRKIKSGITIGGNVSHTLVYIRSQKKWYGARGSNFSFGVFYV